MSCASVISAGLNGSHEIKDQASQDPAQQEKNDKNSGPRITKKFLKDHCKEHKLYLTPSLNDTLYLHYKGFSAIENLEEYSGLRCLWLQCNGLQSIQNLNAQTELRCLFLQQNLIRVIENIEHLTNLRTLNISNNYIQTIQNISCLPELSTLQIAHNKLETVADVEHLSQCLAIGVLDMSHNHLNDPEVLTVLESMPELRVLNLMGNEVVKKIPNYRKTLIVRLKQLTYLDDHPVFPKDRACAEAWMSGGLEAERREMELWQTRERKKIQDCMDTLTAIRDSARQRKQLREIHEKAESEAADPPESEDSHEEETTQLMSPRREEIQIPVDTSLVEDQSGEEILGEDLIDSLDEQFNEPDGLAKSENLESKREQKDGVITSAVMLERSQEEDQKQQFGIQLINKLESEVSKLEVSHGNKGQVARDHPPVQPPLTTITPSHLNEGMNACGPGPLVTELEDTDELETVYLQPQQPLCIDDLPDLEDIDVEDQDLATIFSSQQVSRPRIEVISGDCDEDVPLKYQTSPVHQMTPAVIPDTDSLFLKVCDGRVLADVPTHRLPSLDAREPMTSPPEAKPNLATHAPRCLIEELD